MEDKFIPDVIIGRLPRYLRVLEGFQSANQQTTSSQEIGRKLNISAAQIRKDLSQFGEFGKQGTGYDVDFLVGKLRSILNIDRVWQMVMVGAGDLGHAIAHYEGFHICGFNMVMIFDNDPEKVGQQVGEFIVQDVASLEEQVRQKNIRVAMITVPAEAAQEVADKLVKAGVRAILNYAPVSLAVPEDVRVQSVDPIIHLQRMTYYLL